MGNDIVGKYKAYNYQISSLNPGFPGGSVVKSPYANAGDVGSLLGQEDSLKKEMATRSSILAWEISRTEEPGGLHSLWSRKGSDTA